MIKNKRNCSVVISLLLIISLLLNSIIVFASEIRFSSDLGEFLTGWKLSVGDKVFDQNTPPTETIEYRKGVML